MNHNLDKKYLPETDLKMTKMMRLADKNLKMIADLKEKNGHNEWKDRGSQQRNDDYSKQPNGSFRMKNKISEIKNPLDEHVIR